MLLLITLMSYYIFGLLFKKQSFQIAVLLISSFVFYAFENPSLLILLVISIVINITASGYIIQNQLNANRAKLTLGLAVAVNIGILAFFKYASFLAGLLSPLFWNINITQIQKDLAAIPLPIGISFYTFQAISLLVDLSRDKDSHLRSLSHHWKPEGQKRVAVGWMKIAFYIAFFPQLIAGPIVKAHDFFGQIAHKKWSGIPWEQVTKCLIYGYFLKMVVADNLKDMTILLTTQNLLEQGAINLLILLYAYSVQIFADFAGYSLIAIGLGYLFGYRFPRNFNFPYISASITEFWQRWHISLSSWLKEYLYIPLGGNRRGAGRTYIHLMIVMLLGGLWHGADSRYLIWGGAYGIILAVERLWGNIIHHRLTNKLIQNIIKGVRITVTFHVVSFLWLLFLMPDFNQVVDYVRGLSTVIRGDFSVNFRFLYMLAFFATPVVCMVDRKFNCSDLIRRGG